MMGSGSDLQMQQFACQDLLQKEGVHSGCLRGKTVLHKWGEAMDQKINKTGFTQKITSAISWQRLFVVVHEGYFLIYKNETSKRPSKVIDLCGFQRVEKEEYLKGVKDVPWPFKVSSDVNSKVMYYGAMTESDLKKWIEAVQRGIDDAKESGRTPVIYEKKESLPVAKTRREKPLPRPPSVHPNEDDSDDDEDGQDDYDYIPDPIEEMQQSSKQTTIPRSQQLPPVPGSGKGAEVVYEESSPKASFPKATVGPKLSTAKPRKDMELPPAPTNNIENARANLKKTPPPVPEGDKATPPVAKKPPALPKPVGKPVAQMRSDAQSSLANKPVPKVPLGGNSHEEAEDDVEYETVDTSLVVRDATWTGSSEDSTELMKSMKEDGVFMIRESTTGNGDMTLQVMSDHSVRKYKISKEGKQFRMAGGNAFDSISELLSFYQKNSIPNHSTKLTKPYSKV